MKSISDSKIAHIKLWPMIVFLLLVAIFVFLELIGFYTVYIPGLLDLTDGTLSSEKMALLKDGIYRITIHLTIWIYSLFIGNVALVFLVWKLKERKTGSDTDGSPQN